MDPQENHIIVKNMATAPGSAAPIPLPDGKQRIPMGSGVITKLLGQGGMAAVYEIWNAQLEMFRAVKLINPGSTETVQQRFQTEIKISAKLSHPNIVEIHGVGEWNGLAFIEMEKIEGIGLDNLIAARGALPPVVCTAIGIMICRALNYAHNQDCSIYGKNYHGVIHRDLKPGNIMVCKNGIVKLMDFGIARPAEVSFHTMDGLVAGTLQYLAPEQLEKKALDVRTDLYALGVTMYEIVTGTVAFPQTSFAQLIGDKTKNKFKPLEDFHIKLPPRLRRAIYKCMEQDPDRRLPSAAALLDELHRIHAMLTGKSPEEIMAAFTAASAGRKVVLARRRRVPWRPIAAVFAGAAIVAGAYLYLWPRYKLFAARRAAVLVAPALVPAAQPALAAPAETTAAAKAPAATPAAEPTAAPVHKRGTSSVKLAPGPAEEKPAARPPRPSSLAELLQEKYGTDDFLVIMEKELKAKSYQNILGLYDMLPKEQARTAQALIYKMRALEKTQNTGRLAQFLESNAISDGEFLLAKAKFSFRNQRYDECKKLLAQCMNLPHAFIDYDQLKQEVYYYTALCVTAQFDASPTEQNYKEALDSWWQLRTALRATPDHEYNKKAISELQRMAKKMQKG
jgi:tRNA A-37 threonylcarbamoyl transferase component Bud32/tetratricopeptide (TPR) repeat protein